MSPVSVGPLKRPVVKILIAVWGAAYVRRFEALSLASILSTGNLPALAEACDVEIVFLTREADVEGFETLPSLRQVRRHAKVRYVPIDDLIVSGLYTVTLTLAFTRGMRIFGDAMTGVHFMYWNADFVLGDGSLAYLARCIAEGRKVVLAGSVRVISEAVEPLLRPMVDAEGVLTMSGRMLSRLVFEHPHLLQVAKTVNQNFCWANSPNHLFWTVGESTLICRFFQIFMFSLRPTVARQTIDGYCDYSFVPVFCPDEPIHVVDDSDKICLLELQFRDQEVGEVAFSHGREEAWRRSIEEWCTPEHARIVRQPIVYHSGELPAGLAATIRKTGAYVDAHLKAIPPPSAHRGHRYWVYGVAAWAQRRSDEARLAGWPAELEVDLPVGTLKHVSFDQDRACRVRPTPPRARLGSLRWFRQVLVGAPPAIGLLHPDAPALVPLSAAARNVAARLFDSKDYRVLVVADLGGWLDPLLPVEHPRIYRTEPIVAAIWRFTPSPVMDEVVIYNRDLKPDVFDAVMKNVRSVLKPGGRITVLAHYPLYAATVDDPSLRDARVFAAAPYEDRMMSFHAGSAWQRQYALRLSAWLGVWRRGGRRNRLKAALGAAAALVRRSAHTIRPWRAATPAAAVFTGRTAQARNRIKAARKRKA